MVLVEMVISDRKLHIERPVIEEFNMPKDACKYAMYLAVVISPAVVGQLAESLGIDEVSAMNKYFTSSVYVAISDEGQKLWHHSPQLLASLVEEELRTGKFTYPQEAL